MKLCKDCKHYKAKPYSPNGDICRAYTDPVYGGKEWRSATLERNSDIGCGPEGKLWEAKG